MTEREQQRMVNHRLAIIRHVEEVTGNVAEATKSASESSRARSTSVLWIRKKRPSTV